MKPIPLCLLGANFGSAMALAEFTPGDHSPYEGLPARWPGTSVVLPRQAFECAPGKAPQWPAVSAEFPPASQTLVNSKGRWPGLRDYFVECRGCLSHDYAYTMDACEQHCITVVYPSEM